MRVQSVILAIGLVAGAGGLPSAGAQEAPVAAAPRISAETASLTIRDGRTLVGLRVPLALHRGANAFRLYGSRPLTLADRSRRRDLYRDAFLELATRSRLNPQSTAWDSLSAQWGWLQGIRGAGTALPGGDLEKRIGETLRQYTSLPSYRHAAALLKALGADPLAAANDPVLSALQLRAVATDEAQARLLQLGRALNVEAVGTDPALRDGYHMASAEFEEVRKGLWPAIGASLRKNQGRLLLSAVKQIVLSHLGAWAIFGQIGWQGVESTLSAEYRGQLAICYATLAQALSEAATRAPEYLPLALYAEYAVNYQLTEALKGDQVMALKPAGGRSAGSWQIQCSTRAEELRRALAAPPAAGG
ncbi:MAG TPA: hypothetical protein VFU47_17590 [Armatimonadota bacterium]|nr:hypothetical protein [Armatimonadota bacterium]